MEKVNESTKKKKIKTYDAPAKPKKNAKVKGAKAENNGERTKTEKQPGIVAKITDITASGKGVTVTEILDRLCKAFPERRREAMQNSIRGTFAALTKKGMLKVAKADGSRMKTYSIA